MTTKTRFTLEQEEWLRSNYYTVGSYSELVDKFNAYFGTSRNISMIRDKCRKQMGLKGMPNSTRYGNKPKEQLPVGTIRRSQTGTYIKVLEVPPRTCFSGYDEPYWLPLQKKIYQDAYGEIQPDQMVCFLDHNPDNFELDNLYCIDRSISAIMAKNHWWTESKDHTLAAIKWCELYYALKEFRKGE